MKCTILVGPPGSGKSTYAITNLTLNTAYVNQDSQGKVGHADKFAEAIQLRSDIIVDRMNFNKEQRKRYITVAKANGYETEIIVFHESYQTCLNRCEARKDHLTVKDKATAIKVLNFFFSNYERVQDNEADVVERRWPDIEKPSAICIDLDGTLCNIEHRQKFVLNERKNWPMFFAGISKDTPNKWCKQIIDVLSAYHKIVLCTGRGGEYKETTEAWLKSYKVHYDDLFMRQIKDYRKDSIIKEVLLDFEILTRYEPTYMIDDRQQVVDMYRNRGYTVLQCAPGNF